MFKFDSAFVYMVNKGSEGNKLQTKLKHYQDEMIKVSEERAHYQQELEYIRYQMKKALDENEFYKQRIKVLEEEKIKLRNENERLNKENNDLIGQLKVIKKITEGY
ncbi:MAG TPA: hypothetical protein VLA74_12765 [Nitrososphaeraceae archaeon]|nr:hypothetical protein [Nitrososphaeraceae archaeon]